MNGFELDPRLANDSIFLGKLALCELRLMNDSRWPWMVLVPARAGAVEIHDLSETDQALLANETALVAKLLKSLTNCEKINSAALGNIVRQLHVHVVARSKNDPNWPGPVWGYGTREPYSPEEAGPWTKRLQTAFLQYFS
jgi:diadenosine tetraphosphate (Ap4A) HIT family hydrolase